MRSRWLALVGVAAVCAAAAAAPRKIVVAQDGSGQFKTVTEALAAADKPTQENPVDIVIKPGTYHEMITTHDWVNLIGEDRDTCIMTYHGGTKELWKKHTIWATTNTTIRNLTIIGIQVKYCIHSDGGGPYVLRVENCVLRREYPEEYRKAYKAGFGIGLHADQHITMKDCRIEADIPIYFHNWYHVRKPCSMTLEKCILKGRDKGIWLICLGSLQRDFYVVHDGAIEGAPVAIERINATGRPHRDGKDEIELFGSGNSIAGKIVGAEMADDSKDRRSGMDRARAAEPRPVPTPNPGKAQAPGKHPLAGKPLEEDYGTASGKADKLRAMRAWTPYPKGRYHMAAVLVDDTLVLTCPPASENPKPFGAATGLRNREADMPLVWEARMKFTYVKGGKGQMYYCRSPQGWLMEWWPDKICDAGNVSASVLADTTQWQTYRFVARGPEDVRVLVDGVPGEGVKLKPFKHSGRYFQFRLWGHGSKCEIDWVRARPAEPAK